MRRFLQLVEQGRTYLPAADLPDLGPGVLPALRAAGILRNGDPGMVELSLPDLGRLLRRLYGVLSHGTALPTELDDRPVLLGWTGEGAAVREVVLVAHPSRGLPFALRRPYRSLILVPLARHVNLMQRQRHGPGALVQVEALEHVLRVRGGKVVRSGRAPALTFNQTVEVDLHATPGQPARPSPRGAPVRAPGPEAPRLAGAQRWNQVRVCRLEGEVLRVEVAGRIVHCGPADLGMVHPRTRRPTAPWRVLVAMCEAHGLFQTTNFGSADATKKLVSRLRARLRELFDLRASPFHRYREDSGWRTRFAALPELPEHLDEDAVKERNEILLGDKSPPRERGDVDFSPPRRKRKKKA